MDWKELLKHTFILIGITLVFGAFYSIFQETFRLSKFARILWIPAVITIILIPLIYSFFIKKSIKEIAVISLTFIIVFTTLAIPVSMITREIRRDSIRDAPLASLLKNMVGMNPIGVVYSPVCMPYVAHMVIEGSDTDYPICLFEKYGRIGIYLIPGIIAFFLISITMIVGSYLSKKLHPDKISPRNDL